MLLTLTTPQLCKHIRHAHSTSACRYECVVQQVCGLIHHILIRSIGTGQAQLNSFFAELLQA
jgi:hypothetical protein